MKIRILEPARIDLRAAAFFYDATSRGLGDYFLDSIRVDIESLKVYAGIHVTEEGYFRMLAKRFLFAVYYLVRENSVDIFAILECRRDPTWIKRRLRRS